MNMIRLVNLIEKLEVKFRTNPLGTSDPFKSSKGHSAKLVNVY